MDANKILKKHENANEMHFHEIDREWIIEAMEEYVALRQPLVSGSLPSEEYELERLYHWVTNEKREPAQTKFTSGKTRDLATEIEHRFKGNDR